MSYFQIRKKRCLFKGGYLGILICVAISVIFWVGLGISDMANAGMLVYPAKGQSAEQQQTTQRGGAVRGAAGGALLGAGIGAIAGDTGEGAAIGAGTGAVVGGVRRRRHQQQQETANQQAQAQQQAQIDRYNKAKAVCLEGRGYTVK